MPESYFSVGKKTIAVQKSHCFNVTNGNVTFIFQGKMTKIGGEDHFLQ